MLSVVRIVKATRPWYEQHAAPHSAHDYDR
jgi:hypothetical protein